MRYYAILFMSIFYISLNAQTIITDSDLGSSEYFWTNDIEYILDGLVFLEEGGVLNIEAGTIIKGNSNPSNGDNTSALIITKGAKIFALGTKDAPIIFTGDLDDLSITNDLTETTTQIWGGLIILGRATVGEDGGTDFIEGIDTDEPRGQYGGTDDDDNSGVLNYVSIRHGGSVLGADNEINGLTLGGVGKGTEISYIEIFANKDDGIEFFGGTVNVDHAVVAFVGDDCFDFDESWNGRIQFLFSIQTGKLEGFGDNAIEYDGSEATNGEPLVAGRIYNGTFIGAESGNTNSDGIRIKDAGAVKIYNSVFIDQVGYAARFEDASVDYLVNGTSEIEGNLFYGYATFVQGDPTQLINLLIDNNENTVDPGIASISRETNYMLDPRPFGYESASFSGAIEHNGSEAINTSYKGAFKFGYPNDKTWAHDWTAVDDYGYLYEMGFTSDIKEDLIESTKFKVFPNPTSDVMFLEFELSKTTNATAILYNAVGQPISWTYLGKLGTGKITTEMQVSGLPNGLYTTKIISDLGIITQSFIKEN